MTRSSYPEVLLRMGLLLCFALSNPMLSLSQSTLGSHKYGLPCEANQMAQSGDGGTVWVVCQDSFTSSSAYALDLASSETILLTKSTQGLILLTAAPVDSRALLNIPKSRIDGTWKSFLYQGTHKIAELPMIFPEAWSADASKIYVLIGGNLASDPWDNFGVFNLDDMRLSRRRIVPTENLHVCSTDGRLLAGDGRLKGDPVEYDLNLENPRRQPTLLPGEFSATCRYIATGSTDHGPVPWQVIEVATGRRLFKFDFTAEGKKEEFEFLSWNPKHDGILLRVVDHPVNADGDGPPSTLQVFDVERGCVAQSFENLGRLAEFTTVWSSDGNSLVVPKGEWLYIVPVTLACPSP